MRLTLLIGILIGINIQTIAQSNLDSLETAIPYTKQEDLSDIYLKLISKYRHTNFEKAKFYAHELIANSKGNADELGRAHYELAIVYVMNNFPDSAKAQIHNAMHYFQEVGQPLMVANGWMFMGNLYDEQGDLNEAASYLMKALKLFEQDSSLQGIAQVSLNLGNIFIKLKQFDRSLGYYIKSLEIFDKLEDYPMLGSVHNNIGMVYENQNIYDTAIFYFEKARLIQQKNGEFQSMAGSMLNLGMCYMDLEEYDKALHYYREAIVYFEKYGRHYGLIQSKLRMGELYQILGNDSSEIFYLKALQLAEKDKAKELIVESSKNLAAMYSDRKDFERAYKFHTQYFDTYQEVYEQERIKAIEEIQVKYETTKKEKAYLELKNENEIKQLKLNHKNEVLSYMTLGIILSIVLLIVILYLYRKRSMAYKNLVSQNLELARCDKRILEEGEHIPDAAPDNNDEQDEEYAQSQEIIKKLYAYMSHEKPYLYGNISIEDVASRIGTNRTYLSKAINNVLQKNFNSLINEYRVRASRQLLTDADYQHISIEGIGKMVGYNSRMVFHNNFKKITGLSPSYFRDSAMNAE